jgi:hypothetical protein
MYIAVILENFSQAQEDVQQVNKHTVKKENSYDYIFRV